MNTASFGLLLRWEVAQLAKSRLLWLVLTIVGAMFIWGAQSGAALSRAQIDAQVSTQARERAWLGDINARAEKYRRASDTPLPYWQDPTDIAGFSQYFLRAHSFKPHLPLAPLAVGVADLLPDRQQIKLATPFGVDDAYDFQNPRGLALGRFDLAFAVSTLLPVAIILLTVLLSTYERDRGILRLIAAQSLSPRSWLTARMLSLAVLLLPGVTLLFLLALMFAGVSLTAAMPELSAALVVLVAYALFWLAVCGAVLSLWPRASGALAALSAVWLAVVVAVPLLATAVGASRPPAITAAQEVDAKRTVNDRVQEQRDDIVRAAFRARPELAGFTDRIEQIDYATRLSFLVPELESRLGFVQEAREAEREWNGRLAGWVSFVSPNLGVESALATLAGTDLARHRLFEAQSRHYQLALRAFFYPLLHREITSPTPYHAYGHFSFTAFDSVPRFQMKDVGAGERVGAVVSVVGWLLGLALALFGVSLARLRRWPEGV